MKKILNHKGFTLVEMAIVLVIVGLLVGMGAGMIGPLTTMSKVRESREVVESDIASVNSYAAGNNHLPDITNSNFLNIFKAPQDSWGRNLIYLYDCRLASTNPATPTPDALSCTNAAASFSKDTICGRRTTTMQVITELGSQINNVAYVILSLADDALVNTKMIGLLSNPAATPGPANPATLNNAIIPFSGFVTPIAPATTATITLDPNYTDIVRWVTLDELRSKIGCQGAQLKIVNNELPYGYVGTQYSATISADGGFRTGTNYKWCIETSQNIFKLDGGHLSLNSTLGTIGTNPAGVKAPPTTTCTEANAISSQTLIIGDTPISTSDPTSELTLHVWDDNSNYASKKMVLTINPQQP